MLRIAAAADLQPVLPPLLAEFRGQTGVPAEAVYASSATLTEQILNGGPFDLFLSADLSFPEKVIAAGLAEEAKPVPYARGTLVLWARRGSYTADRGLRLELLQDPVIRKVAVADAAHAPYGCAAREAIRNLGLLDALKPKLVFAENIAQAAQFVDSGNAGAGFLSLTAALTPRMKAAGTYIEIPPAAYSPILQGAIVLRSSANQNEARRFLLFLRSPAVREQLEARGLKAP
ncbi:MAG TPA: molybdate ABC transporter substrate-binding protein [Acidobacteriaceae bacterium]|nr:molybdate ABC transporter substrate-binding protein [Acidobacteriaceae bacterium]